NDKDNIVVQSVIKNYPAEKSGLKAGDIILKVDGEAVKASESTKASSKIKGKAGTSVVLTIKRGDKTFDVTVKREEIIVESVKSEVKEDDIGYIQITSFDKNTYNEFKEHMSSLQKKNVKSLIIDLRDNPGGLLDVCVDIADYLLGEGTIVYTKDNKGDTQYYKSDADKIDLPIVVLINENSASASEILTAAIVDNKAGIAVGTTSYGKGLVQSVKEFKDGTGYKLTTAQYYTPNGDYINKQGIKPDIEEKDTNKQLDRAIEYIKNKK
ncbi:MAG: S41 family peptidase, partial [Intestinibacter sp.]|uniref:S41 family peptidase n=1 Tax=Intestinibacter sp. TaxID=1965304 RepID=UPI003F1683DD